MQTEISSGPAFAFGEIQVPPGSSVRVEAGAMAMTRGDVAMARVHAEEVSSKGCGAHWAVKASSSTTSPHRRAASWRWLRRLPGQMTHIPLTGGTLLVQSGSWVASDLTVDVDSAWGGSKSFFSGEGLLLLRCSGHGDLLIASYGAIRDYTLNAGETMTLDTGHVVAFDDTIHYAVRKSGS